MTDLLEQDYLNVYPPPLLNIIKNLKNLARYDCWEDKTPEEWLELCRNNTEKSYDGSSKIYHENDYVMRNVKVLSYDEKQMKFEIMFLHSDAKVFVSRLSLLFFCENAKEFEFRKEICEKRRDHVDEFLRFTRYLDRIPMNKVTLLSPKVSIIYRSGKPRFSSFLSFRRKELLKN